MADTHVVTVTLGADGSATEHTMRHIIGRVNSIRYTKNDFSEGVDFSIVGKDTRQALWLERNVNASKTIRPTVLLQKTDGTDLTDRDFILLNERIEITVTGGAEGQTGVFEVLVETPG